MNKFEKRLNNELLKVRGSNDWAEGAIDLKLTEGTRDQLIGQVRGPMNAPYHKGVFKIKIGIPADYPLKPPEFRFSTKIWHPNVV